MQASVWKISDFSFPVLTAICVREAKLHIEQTDCKTGKYLERYLAAEILSYLESRLQLRFGILRATKSH